MRGRGPLFAILLPLWLLGGAGCGTTPVSGDADVVLAEGKRLYEARKYKAAQRRFRGVTKYHEDSDEAEEALFLEGECKRLRRQGTPAFDAYKAFVKKYPNSRFSVGVAMGEYELGLAHFRGDMPGFLFFKADRGYGVRILEHMQINFRNHSLADDALMRVAKYQLEQKEWEEAADTLAKLLAEYPRSENMLWARFQLARTLWLQNQGARYDDRLLLRARRGFEDYVGTARLMGEAERQKEQIAKAEEMIRAIDERRAEKEYLIGRFYERTGHPDSAAYYYRHCVRTFPGTKHAGVSGKRLETLRARQEKEGAAKRAQEEEEEVAAG